MQDIYDIVKNIEGIYDSNTSFQVLKDFERVISELHDPSNNAMVQVGLAKH